MKIVTYNILTGGKIRCGNRQEHILKTLKEINSQKINKKNCPIDILVLQEANDFDSENKPFMEQIQKTLGFDYAQVSNATKFFEDGLRYNTVIYSRWPLKEIHDFHNQLSTAGLSAVVETEKFGRIGISSHHLYIEATANSEDRRLQELDVVVSHMKRYDQHIIVGDFNSISKRDNYVLEEMDDGIEKRFDVLAKFEKLGYIDSVAQFLSKNNPTLEQLKTYPTLTNDNNTFTKPVRIDFVLLKNLGKRIKAAGVHHSNASDLGSDHYPVWAVIE